jgi:hypothetical protein
VKSASYVARYSDGCSQTQYIPEVRNGVEDDFESPDSFDQELRVDQRAEIQNQSVLEGIEEPDPELILSLIPN